MSKPNPTKQQHRTDQPIPEMRGQELDRPADLGGALEEAVNGQTETTQAEGGTSPGQTDKKVTRTPDQAEGEDDEDDSSRHRPPVPEGGVLAETEDGRLGRAQVNRQAPDTNSTEQIRRR